jgi:hypothetical protein
MLAAGTAALACHCPISDAHADAGACGLETGIWAAVAAACANAGRPEEAVRRFGENALLEWGRGFYRFQGAHCTIFSDTLDQKRCTLRVECSYERSHTMAEWDIQIVNPRQLLFGTRPDSPTYSRCSADPVPH